MTVRMARATDAIAAAAISMAALLWTVQTVVFGGLFIDTISMALFVAVTLAPCAALAVALNLYRPRGWKRRWAVCLLASLVLIYLIPWHPRQRFVMRLSLIPAGATASEVRSRMQGYLGGEEVSSLEESPKQVDAVINYRWNDTDGRFNSDVGQVYLRKGRVVGKNFLPD